MGTRTITLSSGDTVFYDADDQHKIDAHTWRLEHKTSKKYVVCTTHTKMINGKRKTRHLYLHRVIMNLDKSSLRVDHINGNGLDNRKANLRLATQAQNCQNCIGRKGTSRYKGVSFDKSTGKWVAQIQVNKRKQHLGSFVDEIDAARRYDKAAVECFGEFAKTNFTHKG